MPFRPTEPVFFSQLTQMSSIISFNYSGGSTPGKVRTVRFASWFWAWGERLGNGEGYMQAYDEKGFFKTYHYSKMSQLTLLKPEPKPDNEVKLENTSNNNISNWTSWIKEGYTIEFSYVNETYIRNVMFIKLVDILCSTKKILCYENQCTKTFFVNKMTIHKIYLENQDDEDIPPTPIVLHNEVRRLETKQNLLIKEMKVHINSQNEVIETFKEKCSILEEDCLNLEKDKKTACNIMTAHKGIYPSTWESDYVPKHHSTRAAASAALVEALKEQLAVLGAQKTALEEVLLTQQLQHSGWEIIPPLTK